MGYNKKMKFVSTRDSTKKRFSFEEAIFLGVAPDGGFFMPEEIPQITKDQLQSWSEDYLGHGDDLRLYHRIALDILMMFIEDIPEDELRVIIDRIQFPIRTSNFSPNHPSMNSSEESFRSSKVDWSKESIHIMELIHGPTYTFKDFGMQFLGGVLSYFVSRSKQRITIIVATSGDTGSAAIHAVEHQDDLQLFVMYPGGGRITPLQERQMATSVAENIHCIRFDGSSDDADVVMNQLFADKSLAQFRLTTMNSINIARVLMQIVHFVYGYVQCFASGIQDSIKNETDLPRVRYCIPTGGLGNGSSCTLTRMMGIPIDKIILAVNENDTLARLFQDGKFAPGATRVTNAPAMDISNPYNLERIVYLISDRNPEVVGRYVKGIEQEKQISFDQLGIREPFSQIFFSASASQDDVEKQISRLFTEYKTIIDPHTAVGVHVLGHLPFDWIPTICVSTAHPGKFPEVINKSTNSNYSHEALENLHNLPMRVTDVNPDPACMVAEVKAMICKCHE